MGLYNRYLRMYSHQEEVRVCGYNPKKWLSELILHYPAVYEMLPPCHEGCSNDPYLIIAFKRHRKTGVRQIEWVIRGYEKYATMHPTIIYIPVEPILMAPHEPRDQNDCFLRLLQSGYRVISLKDLCAIYHVHCV